MQQDSPNSLDPLHSRSLVVQSGVNGHISWMQTPPALVHGLLPLPIGLEELEEHATKVSTRGRRFSRNPSNVARRCMLGLSRFLDPGRRAGGRRIHQPES